MNFLIKVKLQNNELIATVDGDLLENDLFYFYLLKSGKVEQKLENWTTQKSWNFQLVSSGFYSVQTHLKRDNVNIYKISIPIKYINGVDQEQYSRFLEKSSSDFVIPPLKFYKTKNHYCDFALCAHNNSQTKKLVDSKEIDTDLFIENIYIDNLYCQLISTKESKKQGNNRFIFSGSVAYKNTLYFGQENIDFSLLDELENEIGTYHLLKINTSFNQINISTDYFGIGKIYYYQNHEIFVASNRYHLLLLILNNLKIKLTLNKAKILANLAFVNMQPFHQNFSRKMDVEGIFCLPIDKNILIGKEGIKFLPSKLNQAWSNSNKKFDQAMYEKLLKESKKEIINNVKIVLEHPDFKYVIVDLSGGLDSRMVYSAVTHLQQFRDKIRINSHNVLSQPLDLDVALSLNSIYGFQYDDLPSIKEPYYADNPWNDYWSYYLGIYYSYVPSFYKNKRPDSIRLVGFYGEICARPYYSRSLLNTELDVDNVESFVEMYFEKYQYMSFVGDESSCLSLLKNLFCEELDLLPGDSALEKFENHYLFYRNGLHCADFLRSDISCPEWGPLMSKTLFELKNMTYHKFKSIKLQLDCLNFLNPVIATHIYQSEKDNTEKQKLVSNGSLISYEPCFDNMEISMKNDREKWDNAEAEKKKNINIFKDNEDNYNKFLEKSRNPDERYKIALEALVFLIDKEVLEVNGAGQCIWLFFNEYYSDKNMRSQIDNLTNKIMSIYYQFILLEGN